MTVGELMELFENMYEDTLITVNTEDSEAAEAEIVSIDFDDENNTANIGVKE